jgi:hypothetical protein
MRSPFAVGSRQFAAIHEALKLPSIRRYISLQLGEKAR